MRISWNWLSELVDLSSLSGPSALAELLTQRGLEVESTERSDQGFDHVVTAQILEKKPHPQADRLSLCQVTIGSGEPLEIVCGAQNMKAGDKVALAMVGAHLPNGTKIAAGKIRGVVSHGMLCSEEELKLKESSEGILILPPETALGEPLAKILGRDDVTFTLKLTANRSDCFSHYGIAREVGAAVGKKPRLPKIQDIPSGNSPISTALNAGEASTQFYGCYIDGVKIGPSPDWLVKRLESLGNRSINNVVDASNLVLFEFGHPMHVYDADRIQGRKLEVRLSRVEEQLPLLDGETITLTGQELVIADAGRAVALAGVMGGGNSEVTESTRNLFIECAIFDPKLVRKASTRFQRKTDGAQRFERGVDPTGLQRAMARLATVILEVAGGQITGSTGVVLPGIPVQPKKIHFSPYYINDFLGFTRDQPPLTQAKVSDILTSLDCQVVQSASGWDVTPPAYRLDLNIQEDFAEEVARCLGYDLIPATIPPLSASPVFAASSVSRVQIMDRAKESLVRSGLHETLNFSFTSQSWLSRFNLTSSARVLNPLSEEYEYLVPSLIPGLIRNTLDNLNHHFGSEPLAVRLFELRPVFSAPAEIAAQGQDQTGVDERWKLSFVVSGPRYAEALRSERGEIDFSDLKAIMDRLLADLGARGVRYSPLAASRVGGHALFHPGQSVEVLAGNSVAGYFGLLHPGKAKDLKTRGPIWMAELDWETLAKFSRSAAAQPAFKAWPEFPSMERDFALVVKSDVTVEKICQLALKAGKPLAKVSKVFDIYRGAQVVQGMTSVAVRVIFYDESRSLQESEAEAASARILECWKNELGAELRG